MMRTLLTRRAGQPGTKKLVAEHGTDLLCVRYRYDDDLQQRLKTVELVISRVDWQPGLRRRPKEDAEIRFRLANGEDLLRRAVLFAGGRWDEATDTWTLSRSKAGSLGLAPRILHSRGRGGRGKRRD